MECPELSLTLGAWARAHAPTSSCEATGAEQMRRISLMRLRNAGKQAAEQRSRPTKGWAERRVAGG